MSFGDRTLKKPIKAKDIINTSSPGKLVSLLERVKDLETSLSTIQTTEEAKVRGTITVGDIITANGTLSVTGNITSANASSSASDTTISIVFPAVINPIVSITVESLGTVGFDNDITPAIIANLTSTGMDVFFEEVAAVVQNIRLHIVVEPQ